MVFSEYPRLRLQKTSLAGGKTVHKTGVLSVEATAALPYCLPGLAGALLCNFPWKILTGASGAFAWRTLHKRLPRATELPMALFLHAEWNISRFPFTREHRGKTSGARLSVRLVNGASAAFVSPGGQLFTFQTPRTRVLRHFSFTLLSIQFSRLSAEISSVNPLLLTQPSSVNFLLSSQQFLCQLHFLLSTDSPLAAKRKTSRAIIEPTEASREPFFRVESGKHRWPVLLRVGGDTVSLRRRGENRAAASKEGVQSVSN